MNIAVCDDNLLDIELTVDLLEYYFSDKSVTLNIDRYKNGANLIYEVEDGQLYDIIFLDIFMDKLLGIDVAKTLRDINFNGEIIFLTSSSKFAVDSYDVQASGYLLKPLCYDKLEKTIDKTIHDFDINTYRVRRRSNFVLIPYNEIIYVESNNSKCILHRKSGEDYNIYKKLGEIEDELHDSRFLRSHQSYLVNMDYIIQAGSQFELSTGDSVLIRQRQLREIRTVYLDYSEKHTSHTVKR